ncbi:MAG TPA: hypothetical protein VH575_01410 [Gemmataceae bacterium]
MKKLIALILAVAFVCASSIGCGDTSKSGGAGGTGGGGGAGGAAKTNK